MVAEIDKSRGTKTTGNLAASISRGESHAEDHADKVHIADVGPDAAVLLISQFNKAPVQASAWVLGVEDGWLNKAIRAIKVSDHVERKVSFAEVDSTRIKSNRKVHSQGLASGGQPNGDGLSNAGWAASTARAGVDLASSTSDEDDTPAVVLSGDVGINHATAEVVDESQGQGRCCHTKLLGLNPGSFSNSSPIQRVFLCDDDILHATWAGNSESGVGGSSRTSHYCAHKEGKSSEDAHFVSNEREQYANRYSSEFVISKKQSSTERKETALKKSQVRIVWSDVVMFLSSSTSKMKSTLLDLI